MQGHEHDAVCGLDRPLMQDSRTRKIMLIMMKYVEFGKRERSLGGDCEAEIPIMVPDKAPTWESGVGYETLGTHRLQPCFPIRMHCTNTHMETHPGGLTSSIPWSSLSVRS